MKVRAAWSTLILVGSIVVASVLPSVAQPSIHGMSAPTETVTPAPQSVIHHTQANSRKHRHWRHRGGKHPHYGSRLIRH